MTFIIQDWLKMVLQWWCIVDNQPRCKTGGEQEESPLTAEKIREHGKHPNSLANLKLYEKGVSGNPGGRPVKYAKLKKGTR